MTLAELLEQTHDRVCAAHRGLFIITRSASPDGRYWLLSDYRVRCVSQSHGVWIVARSTAQEPTP